MQVIHENNFVPVKSTWSNDDELFAVVRKELFTAVIGDIMDKMGLLNQFLPPGIQPLRHDMFLAGRAMPVWGTDVSNEHGNHNDLLSRPFGLMLEALDDLKKNEVYICSGASSDYALWGELMSTRAQILGAAGAVVNGYSRDTNGILSLNFPTFSTGRYAQDQAPRGKVLDFRVPIRFGHVYIRPGDIVIGDIDGVCVVPKEAEEEVFRQALEKARGEKLVGTKIREGMSARKAFDTYNIL